MKIYANLSESLMDDKMAEEIVTGPVLAKRLGLTATSVSRLAANGVLVKKSRGRYSAWASARSYIAHVSKTHRTSPTQTARAHLLELQADKLAMEMKLAAGELCRVSDVRNEVQIMLANLKSGMMSLKSRLPFGREELSRLDDAIREVLTELAHNKFNDDTMWTVEPAELAAHLGLPLAEVERLVKAGVLPAPDNEGRLFLWASVRALAAQRRS